MVNVRGTFCCVLTCTSFQVLFQSAQKRTIRLGDCTITICLLESFFNDAKQQGEKLRFRGFSWSLVKSQICHWFVALISMISPILFQSCTSKIANWQCASSQAIVHSTVYLNYSTINWVWNCWSGTDHVRAPEEDHYNRHRVSGHSEWWNHQLKIRYESRLMSPADRPRLMKELCLVTHEAHLCWMTEPNLTMSVVLQIGKVNGCCLQPLIWKILWFVLW